MPRFIVNGGNPLEGEVTVSGAKNAALPILTATLLTQGESVISNVPNLNDVITMIRILRSLGVKAEYNSEPNVVHVSVGPKIKHVAPYELVTKMRASFFVIGPILARMGLAKVPLPGGCAIGSRPVNLHIKGFEALGAKVNIEHGFVIVKADQLRGGKIHLDFPSVGATESIMMAAALADGVTVIKNAAQEPEIIDLANFLNLAGAKISGAGTEALTIEGVDKLEGVKHRIVPDRIEAGTLMMAAAISKGDLLVKEVVAEHVEPVVSKLREAGITIILNKNEARVTANGRIKAIDAKTLPYPGFPTDMQPQLSALMSLAAGTSVITETVFENRFMHIYELKRMGADIRIEGQSAIINGVENLSSAPVRVHDLRGGAALLLAGLATKGETVIEDPEKHLERGYEKLEKKLTALGAQVKGIS